MRKESSRWLITLHQVLWGQVILYLSLQYLLPFDLRAQKLFCSISFKNSNTEVRFIMYVVLHVFDLYTIVCINVFEVLLFFLTGECLVKKLGGHWPVKLFFLINVLTLYLKCSFVFLFTLQISFFFFCLLIFMYIPLGRFLLVSDRPLSIYCAHNKYKILH